MLVLVDPIDGSMNAKRGMPHHAVSIAVAEGDTMADVVFGYVRDFGPAEEWVAWRGGGAQRDGVRLDPSIGERRTAAGKLELVGVESADPRWLREAADDLVEVAHRLRAVGAIASTLCQVGGARLDGMTTLPGLPRGRRRGGPADRPRGRRARGLHRLRRPAVRSARPRAALARRRRADGRGAARDGPRPAALTARAAPGAGPATMGVVIDWTLARQVARGVAGLQPSGDPAPFEQPGEFAAESERLVSAYTGLEPAAPLPAAEAVGRDEWIEANLAMLGSVLEPVAGRVGKGLGPLSGPLGAAAGVLLAVEAGAVSGFLAGRVLGQYEFPVLDPDVPARLLFVAPNLAHAATQLEAEPDDLLRWVALHETTHALQFGGVPWLRTHLAGMVRELLDALSVDSSTLLRLPDPKDLRGLVESVREGGMAALAVGPEGRALLDRMQATMALIEGYAEHVMDAVGADVLPDLPGMRTAMERRRRDRSGLLRVLERLIGLDLKLRQYELGKAFCDEVVDRAGIDGLNRAWRAAESLPTLAELEGPGRLAQAHRAQAPQPRRLSRSGRAA